jgi:hypothetical protein
MVCICWQGERPRKRSERDFERGEIPENLEGRRRGQGERARRGRERERGRGQRQRQRDIGEE